MPKLTLPLFSNDPTDQTIRLMCTRDASDEAVCRRKCLLAAALLPNFVKESKIPQICPFCPTCQFPRQSSFLNFLTARDIRETSTNHLHEIGNGQSKGDVISGLERPLVAEIDLRPLSTIGKALIG
jgi:hypothetical protein